MGDGSGDSQKVWHIFLSSLIKNSTILDVGAGAGLSKKRLERGNNKVTTQDINRARMTVVDIIRPIEEIEESFDYLTTFDVIEHVIYPTKFIKIMWSMANKGIFVATANKYKIDREWHWTPLEFIELFNEISTQEVRYFFRYKTAEKDYITETTQELFLHNKDSFEIGLLLKK